MRICAKKVPYNVLHVHFIFLSWACIFQLKEHFTLPLPICDNGNMKHCYYRFSEVPNSVSNQLKYSYTDLHQAYSTVCSEYWFSKQTEMNDFFINILEDVYEKLEDTKGAIRSHKSKKDRQYNGQKKKDKHRSIKHHIEN